MNLGPLHTLVQDVTFDAHGVAVVLTTPAPARVTTTTVGVWDDPLIEDLPVGRDLSRREPKRIMTLRRDEVSDVPRGSKVVAAETLDGEARNWQSDGYESTDPYHFRVILIPEPV